MCCPNCHCAFQNLVVFPDRRKGLIHQNTGISATPTGNWAGFWTTCIIASRSTRRWAT
jgi:hypothetical protein